jgi:hypothetical protein
MRKPGRSQWTSGAIRSASRSRSNQNKNATDFTDLKSLASGTLDPERPDREILDISAVPRSNFVFFEHNLMLINPNSKVFESVESVKSVAFLFFYQCSLKTAASCRLALLIAPVDIPHFPIIMGVWYYGPHEDDHRIARRTSDLR